MLEMRSQTSDALENAFLIVFVVFLCALSLGIAYYPLYFGETRLDRKIDSGHDCDGDSPCRAEAMALERSRVIRRVQTEPMSLADLDEKWKADVHIVFEAVSRNGWALAHASPTLREDRRLVWAALESDGKVLKILSDKDRDSEDVVLKSLEKDAAPFEFASERLKNLTRFVLKALALNRGVFDFVAEALRSDPQVLAAANKKISI